MPRFACPNCQKALKTSAMVPAGKKIKCPGCSHVFLLPRVKARVLQTEEVTEGRSAGAAAPDDSADDNSGSEDRPARRRSTKKAATKRSPVLILGAVALLLVVLAFTSFVWPGFLLGTTAKKRAAAALPSVAPSPKPAGIAEKSDPANANQAEPARPGPEPANGGAVVAAPPDAAVKGTASAQPAVSSSIREVMVKLTRGPQGLGNKIGKELKIDPPAWDALEAQTTEYVALASSLAAHDPPKGTKDSWTKQTAAFAESAAGMERSIKSKDRSAALAVHQALQNSCMACHQQHKGRPGR